jgi:hypothetical protein
LWEVLPLGWPSHSLDHMPCTILCFQNSINTKLPLSFFHFISFQETFPKGLDICGRGRRVEVRYFLDTISRKVLKAFLFGEFLSLDDVIFMFKV